MPTVKDFYDKINQIAPFKASYSWDNTGLLVGDMSAPVTKVLLALDITDQIVDYAIEQGTDLIISHHPVIFQPQKSIITKKILRLIEHKIAVISAHTNLDVCKLGVNTTLAQILQLQGIQPLSMSSDIAQFQIAVYVPADHLEKVMSAMHSAGAGVIGNYSHCATYFDTHGQYKALEGANPFIPPPPVETMTCLSKINEIKLELLCEDTHLPAVTKAMFQAHPYETPAYTIIPLKQKSANFGLGCYGSLATPTTLADFAHFVRTTLAAPFVKLWTAGKPTDTPIKNVAVCGGSGNSIIGEARSVADVFVSADFTYHFLLDAPMPVIDAGHFWTENPVLCSLKALLSEVAAMPSSPSDIDCQIEILPLEKHDIGKLQVISE